MLVNVYQKWNAYNQQIDALADKIILLSTSQLPISCSYFMTNFRIEIKVMLLGLALFLPLKVNFGNSYNQSYPQHMVSAAVTVLVAQSFLINLSNCIRQAVLPILFPSLCAASVTSPSPSERSFISNLYGNICSTVKQVANKLTFGPEIDQIKQQAKQEGDQLIPKICQVTASIQKFDRFICEQPALFELCERYLAEDVDLISISLAQAVHFVASELDSNNPIDRRMRLIQKLIQVNYLWTERLRFIQRHPVLQERMLAYIAQTESKKARGANLLEYGKQTSSPSEQGS